MNDFTKTFLICLVIFSILGLFFGTSAAFTYTDLVEGLETVSFDSSLFVATVYLVDILESIVSNFDISTEQTYYYLLTDEGGGVSVYTVYYDGVAVLDSDITTLFTTSNSRVFEIIAFWLLDDYNEGLIYDDPVKFAGHPPILNPFSNESSDLLDYIQFIYTLIVNFITYTYGVVSFIAKIIGLFATSVFTLFKFPFDLFGFFFKLIFGF